MKRCSKCGEEKSLSAFARDRRKKDGHRSHCKECKNAHNREYMARYREERPDVMRRWLEQKPDYFTRRYEEKRGDILARARAVYWTDPERSRTYGRLKARRLTAENPEQVFERGRRWRRLNPHKNREKTRRRHAQKLKAPGDGITAEQWGDLVRAFRGRCAYCGRRAKLEAEHVFPLCRGGAHDIENIVPACRSCNARKSTRTPMEWMITRVLEGVD